MGCYPVYPPGGYNSAYNQDSKDSMAQEPTPQGPAPQGPPVRYGVDPGLVIAGVAAAGLLGYAIGDHHNYHNNYCGPGYYRPGPYYGRGYYAPRYYR
ncbi:MAG: hypothetical protein ABIT37_03280 [Luteolibacter sp.]